MFFLNLNTAFANSEVFYEASLVQRGAWIALMLYSAAQENSGRMVACRLWSERKWRELLRIQRAVVIRRTSLWTWECSDLIITGYPIAAEKEAQRKRKLREASRLKEAKAHGAPSAPASEGPPDAPQDDALSTALKKGKEGNEMKGHPSHLTLSRSGARLKPLRGCWRR